MEIINYVYVTEPQGSGEHPWVAILYAYHHTFLLSELSTTHLTPLGGNHWKLHAGLALELAL